MCYETISVMDFVSTKVTNTIATNVSINSDFKKERYKIDCSWTRTHNHLVLKRTLNHLAKLAKWLSVRLRTK